MKKRELEYKLEGKTIWYWNGQGWLVKREWNPGMVNQSWYLTLEDDRLATFFTIRFSS